MPYLARDIKSMLNPSQIYGKAGSPVDIISDRIGVLIVGIPGGEKFSVKPNDLTDDLNTVHALRLSAVEEEAQSAVRRQKRTKSSARGSIASLSAQPSLL
jgi:hypothetical protein